MNGAEVRRCHWTVLVFAAALGAAGTAARGAPNNDCINNGAGDFTNAGGIHFHITGGQISGAGATLFNPFFASPTATNDWIDVNNNGFAGYDPVHNPFPYVDQLATLFSPPSNLNTYWVFQYRPVGSVNGYNEFVENQLCHALRVSPPADLSYFNQFLWANTAGRINWGTFDNPSGTPLEPCEIEFSALDVPSVWATQAPGTPDWTRKPQQAGYGLNPIVSSTGYVSNLQTLSRNCGTCGDGRPCSSNLNCNGTCNGGGVNYCQTDSDCTPPQTCMGASACTPTVAAVSSLNQNFASPDADTIYDVPTVFVPITPIANRGSGVQYIRYTEAQYLFTTGRLPNGENLTAATRSVGSGTRNGEMNSLGIDTSWGRGDNVGDEVTSSTRFNLGPGTQQTNGEGSGQMEQSVQMHRLAVGYTGLGGAGRAASDANSGLYEILNTCKDFGPVLAAGICDTNSQNGGGVDCRNLAYYAADSCPAGNVCTPANPNLATSACSCSPAIVTANCDCKNPANFVRPSINTVLDNCNACTGFTLGGPETFVFRGNPDANRDPMDPFYNASDPALDNQEVANWVNNITESLLAFNGTVQNECYANEVCEFKKCSGAPDAICTGTGQGTCPGGHSCNFINCVVDANCAAIAPGLGDCNVPKKCTSDANCTTKSCSYTGSPGCTVDGDCPSGAQTCPSGFCSIDGLPCPGGAGDCVVVPAQTCRADFCKQSLNMPGQFMALTFFLPNALRCSQSYFDGIAFAPNVFFSQSVHDFVRDNNGLGVGGDTPAFGSKNIAGLVPIRNGLTGGAKYSDGSTTGSYIFWDNDASNYVTISSGLKLSKRNQLTGDFNEDGKRDVNDATQLEKACYGPRAWQKTAFGMGSGTTAFDKGNQSFDDGIPEVMGDFNGDGNFDKEDLRYFADGLAIIAGKLDRKQGAIAIDTALQADGRQFPWADPQLTLHVPPASQSSEPTQLTPKDVNDVAAPFLKTGKIYQLGDFRGDVAGGGPQRCISGRCSLTNVVCTVDGDCARTPPTAGAQPLGWDGYVDAKDIDYCCAMARIGDWSILDDAVFIDLSCDMNGDLKVDADDITELVQVILGTIVGDINLDGIVNAADRAIAMATIAAGAGGCNGSTSCGWADGDLNCDGLVDAADLALFAPGPDVDGDTDVDLVDFAAWTGCLSGPGQPTEARCVRIDFDLDGHVDMADFAVMQASFTGPY